MPISDEIIELEPVKKNKTKLIIMFIIMGVLLAVAVTFLVLYIVKPSVEVGKGKVYGVVEESSSLCLSGEGDDLTYYAAVDNEYTVYASVSAEGETSKGVIWSMDPANSLVKIADGVDPNDPTRCFYTFKPVDKYADGVTQITLTARAEADPNQVVQIKFFIKKQGTEEIKLNSYWRGADGDRNSIENDEITVPYYSDSTNNLEYYISFEQLGSYDAALGKRIDNITREEVDGVSSYKIDVESSDASILEINQRNINETSNPPRFTFTLKKAGTAKIIITANGHSTFAQPIKKELTVNSVNSSKMDIIEQIFFTKEPVGKDSLKTFSSLPLDKLKNRGEFTDTFVMPFNGKYDNFLDHIVLYPLTIQYDREKDAVRTEWKDWVKSDQLQFVASDSKKLNVSVDKNNGNVSLSARAVSDGDDCKLTVQDKITASLNKKYEIKVNIVAQNQKTSASLRLPKDTADKTQEEINAEYEKYQVWEEGDEKVGFSVPQGSVSQFKVNYALEAPDDTDLNSFITNGYLSLKFTLTYNDKCLTVLQGEDSKPIKSGDLNELISSAVSVRKTGTNKFMATAVFSVRINKTDDKGAPVENDYYTLKFNKPGVMQPGASDRLFNGLSPAWETTVVFDVEDVATEAEFIDEPEAMKLLVKGNMYNIGKYNVTSAPAKDQDGLYKGAVSITVQNQAPGEPFPFDLRELVKKNDTGKIDVNIRTSSSISFNRTGDTNNHSLVFKGVNPTNFTDPQARADLYVYNIGGDKIAEFEVVIFVIDPINKLVCDTSINHIYYDSNTDNGHYSSTPADTVHFERPLTVPTDNVYLPSDIGLNVNIYYVNGSADKIKLPSEDVSGARKFYLPDDTPEDLSDNTHAFTFNGSNLLQELDFFKYSYDNRATVSGFTSKFAIEYCINKNSDYINDVNTKSAPSAIRMIQFYRKADKIGVYSDDKYTTLIETDGDDHTYKITMNSGAATPIKLYAAAIMNVGVGSDIIVSNISNPYTMMEQVHFGVSGNFIIDENNSRGKDSSDSQYYVVSFTAAPLDETTKNYDTYWPISGADTHYKINIYVQNYMRHVSAVGIYSDENCTVSQNSLEFGTDAADKYAKTVYVKVEYEAKGGNKFNLFESVTITLPAINGKPCFRVNIDNGKTDVEAFKIKLENKTEIGLNSDTAYRIYKLEIKAVKTDSDTVSATGEMNNSLIVERDSDTTQKANIPLKVIAELEKITYTVAYSADNVSGVSSGSTIDTDVKNITFALKNDSDRPTATFTLSGQTFAMSDGYTGLRYKASNVSGSAPTAPEGLSVATDISKGKIEIAIDGEKLHTLSVDFDIKFKDKNTKRECIIKLHVDVTMDIFSLSTSKVTLDGSDEFATTGGSGVITVDSKKPQFTVKFNDGNNSIAPSADLKNKVAAELLVKDGANYVTTGDITANAIDADGNITLDIPNSLLKSVDANGLEYWVRVKYAPTGGTPVYSQPVQVKFTTTAQGIRLKTEADGNVKIENGKASVDVLSSSNKFKFVAETFNRGTLLDATATGTVGYALYDDDVCTTASSVASVTDGVVNFTTPDNSGKGTIYLKISYTDGNGNVSAPIVVAISYTVAISNDADKFSYLDGLSETITLYKSDSSYTYIDDISKHIKVATNFTGVSTQTLKYNLTGGASSIYSVSYMTVKPVNEGSSTGSLTLEISDGTVVNGVKTVITKTFNVEVIDLGNALTIDKTSAIINIADDGGNSASFKPEINNSYAELNSSYSATAESNKVTVDTGGTQTELSFDKSKFTAESDYGDYTVNAAVTYTLKSNDLYSINSPIVITKSFTLTATGDYTPTFAIKHGTTVVVKNTDITDINGDSFSVEVTNKKTADEGEFTYSVTADNNIVTFDGSDPLLFKFTENKAGSVTFTVTATGYGKTYTSDPVTYTFVYGKGATQSLEMSTDDGANYSPVFAESDGEATTKQVYIDFSDKPYKFKYTVDVAPVGGNITASDISIDYSGNVTPDGALTFDAATKKAYMVFTAEKATSFKVSGSVRANGRTYYTKAYTLTLSAHDPMFNLSATKEIINPATTAGGTYETSSLSVSQTETNFKGDYSVAYSIVDGGDKATVDRSGGTITVIDPITNTSDTTITVRATIKVTNGVHKDAVYTIDKTITIKGVVLPEINWDSSSELVEVGSPVTLSDLFTFTNKADNYTYAAPDYSYEISADGLTAGTDYTFDPSTSKLTVISTTATKAGGLITVKLTATVKGSINNDRTVTAGYIDIVIKPTLQAEPAYVCGAAGKTDISDAVVVNTKDTNGFIRPNDGKVITFAFNGAAVDGISFDGSNIVLNKDFTEKKELSLTATVVMTSGAYADTTYTVPVTVYVLGAKLKTGGTASWNTADVEYNDIDVATKLVPELETPQVISSIEVSDNAFFAVTGNNTASPKITVNRDANVSGGDNQNATLPVTLKVKLNNGHVYFVSGNIDVDSITPAAVVKKDEEVLSSTSEIKLNASDKVTLSVSESHGLDIHGLKVTNDLTDAVISASVSGNTVIFSAGKAVSDIQYSIELSFIASGVTTTSTIKITVLQAPDENAFIVTNTDTTHLYVYGTRTVKSIWTPTTTMEYMKPVSLRIVSNYNGSTINFNSELIEMKRYRDVTVDVSSLAESENFDVQITVSARSIGTFIFTLYYTGEYSGNISADDGKTKTVAITYTINISRTITATFDLQGGVDSSSTQSGGVSCNTQSISSGNFTKPTDPTRAGYKFDGWYTEKVGGTVYDFDSATDPTQSVILYAHWSNAEVTVNFDKNGGAELSDFEKSKTVIIGKTYGALPIPTRAGHEFDGWYTAVSGGTKVESTTTVELTQDETDAMSKTLYAHWTKLNYTVTFDANGGKFDTETTAAKSVEFDTAFDPTWASPSYTDDVYTFDGWYTLPVGGTMLTGSVKITGDITVYAHWKAREYTVTLNQNYTGAPAESTIKVTYGSTYSTLTTPTRTGYDFVGWYTVGGTHVTEDTVVSKNAQSLTLYAHWQAKSYTVTLDQNYTGTSASTVTVTYDSVYGNDLVTPTRTGYNFIGWYTDNTYTKRVKSDDTVKLTAPQTLYAKWEAKTYTVTLVDGASISEITVTFDKRFSYGTNGTNGLSNPSKEGYEFVAWFTDKDCTAGNNVALSATVTEELASGYKLYAKWTAKTYTVTLVDPQHVETETTITVTFGKTFAEGGLSGLTKEGYTFVGWYSDSTHTTKVEPTDLIDTELAGGYTLYAKWEAKTYIVTLVDPQNAETKTSITVTYGKSFGAGGLSDSFINDGYTFGGWYSDKAYTSARVTIGTTVGELAGGYTLYAKWTAIEYTNGVTLDLNYAGAPSASTITVTYGSTYGDKLTTPTRTGYNFIGWYTDNMTYGTKVDSNSVVGVIPDNYTLYAKWEAKTVTVVYIDNGKTKVEAKSFGDSLKVPTLTGYNFDGWYTAAEDGTKVTTVNTEEAFITVYARWTVKTYNVTIVDSLSMPTTSINVTFGNEFGFGTDGTNGLKTLDDKDGYTFVGWFTDNASYTNQILPSAIVGELGENYTLYAKWTFSVTLNYNYDITPKTESVTVVYGTKYGELARPAARTGYEFNGWAKDESGTTAFDNNSTVSLDDLSGGSVVLYAKWTANTYTVSFNQGYTGAGTIAPITVTYDSEYGTLPEPTRSGYRFDGWYTDNTYSTQVTSTSTVNKATNHTLYAKWTHISL